MRQYRWFHNRIGKTIYRKPINWCDCYDCKLAAEIKIMNKDHAYSIYIHSAELGVDFYDKLEFSKGDFTPKRNAGIRLCYCKKVRFPTRKYCSTKCSVEAKIKAKQLK